MIIIINNRDKSEGTCDPVLFLILPGGNCLLPTTCSCKWCFRQCVDENINEAHRWKGMYMYFALSTPPFHKN